MTNENGSPSVVCPTCGTHAQEGATKCLVCGTDLKNPGEREGQSTKAVQGGRIPSITLSIPVALALLGLFLIIGAGSVYLLVRQEGPIQDEILDIAPTETGTATITATASPTATPETPTPTHTPQPTPTPLTYVVAQGDSCIGIAAGFDVSVQSIVLQNSLPATCDTLFIGQSLLIPQPTPTVTPFPTATLSAAQATATACAAINIAYEVQENDTLSTIAANYQVDPESIKAYNGLIGDTVFVGITIIIPLCERGSVGSTPVPTSPPPYAAPNLLLPVDGRGFNLADDSITLQWASVGALRENEQYIVIIEDVTDGEGRRLVEYVPDTKYIVPNSFRPTDNTAHIFRWRVGTVRQIGSDEEGRPVYESAGGESLPRVFSWVGVSPQPTATP